MQMEMAPSYNQLTWFGRGPHDTYWGRDESGLVQIYRSPVIDQDEYMRPQEHGNKREVRWLTLTDENGVGIQVNAMNNPIAASVWPYTLSDLHKATHVHELPSVQKTTTLNIDAVQNGLGDCFVPCPEQYKLQPKSEYRYQFRIMPCYLPE